VIEVLRSRLAKEEERRVKRNLYEELHKVHNSSDIIKIIE
jgi:hypothetical protein